MAAIRRKPSSDIKLWLFDTGCGHDLVSKRDVSHLLRRVHPAVEPLYLKTANGRTRADKVIDIYVDEIAEEVQPYILDSTPAVLSVGVRCAEMGYKFIWRAAGDPYFFLPSGKNVSRSHSQYSISKDGK